MKVKFKEWNCLTRTGRYSNGRIAIRLVDEVTKEAIATATVNLPNISISPNEVLIKDYSENRGMQQALIEAGVIESEQLDIIPSGMVGIPLHRLSNAFFESADWTCPVCDGGPGNLCGCSCDPKYNPDEV